MHHILLDAGGLSDAITNVTTVLTSVWTFISGNWAFVTIVGLALFFMAIGALISLFRGKG